ncbi:UDP-glycosyltransferase 76B1 [Hevea brasiliensis]|nr:UDP-glycosyltransferase 76B1 [Hevea brasiliensis]
MQSIATTLHMEKPRESRMQQRKGVTLLLFPLPLQGHINPMLQLANILYSKGFSIIIIHTKFNSPNPSKYPHFTFRSIPDGLFEHETSTADVVHLVTLLNIKCIRSFHDSLIKLLLDVKEEPIACLITDADWYFTQAVADSMKLPRLVLRTSNISSFLVYAALPLLLEKGYIPIKDSQLEEPVPELPPLKVKDLPGVKTRDVEDFYHLLAELVNETKASSGLIWNSFEDLEQVELSALCKDFPIPIFTIGPFHKYFPATSSSLLTQDKSCISWLDKKAPNSVLYVSFGSIADINEAEFLEIAWGLANSNQPFLWVVRPGLVLGSEWIEPLPHGFLEKLGGRGCIVKWAPQQEVLAHPAIGGFWTHNGWNSTLEGICEGVPMICHPIFGDQRINARYVADIWRIGLHLEYKLERGVIERAIKRLLVEAEGQEMRKRIMTLKEKVEHCLKQGGSSYESLERLTSYILSLQPLSSH